MFVHKPGPPKLSPEIQRLILPTREVERSEAISQLLDIPLETHRGRTTTTKVIGKRGVILQLFYTRCDGTCPGTTELLSNTAKVLGDKLGRDITILSISLDTTRDSVADIRQYARMHNVPDGWYVAAVSPSDANALLKQLRLPEVKLGGDGRIKHTQMVYYGTNAGGRWRMIATKAATPKLLAKMAMFTHNTTTPALTSNFGE
jgi:cytochrome oxidase Cu insertion factor (SCO1/SenC/PrrC family)